MDPDLQASFSACVIPPRVRLAGRFLRPLTLGHGLLLERVGSPFAPDAPAQRLPLVGDNAMAWWILSRDWHSAADEIDGFKARFWMWCFTMTRARFASEDSVSLIRWIRWGCSVPSFYITKDGAGEPYGAPSTLVRAETLARCWGIPWPQCLDVQSNIAAWLYVTKKEDDGVVRITNPEDDREAIERANDPAESAERQKWAKDQEARLRGANADLEVPA